MCGRYQDRTGWHGLVETFDQRRIPIVFPEASAAPNLPASLDIRPTQEATILRARDDGVELVRARWWLVPSFHRGPLKEWRFATFNARAESLRTTRSFRDSFRQRRCLVAATGWYEWTGPKTTRTKWLFTPRDGEPMMLAGLWDRAVTADLGTVESFTIVTQPAGAPLNAYHDRAPVVLFGDEWGRWLHDDAPDDLLAPESRNRFEVTAAD